MVLALRLVKGLVPIPPTRPWSGDRVRGVRASRGGARSAREVSRRKLSRRASIQGGRGQQRESRIEPSRVGEREAVGLIVSSRG